jgi:hypothetical protein
VIFGHGRNYNGNCLIWRRGGELSRIKRMNRIMGRGTGGRRRVRDVQDKGDNAEKIRRRMEAGN